jgi:hypothetical protein
VTKRRITSPSRSPSEIQAATAGRGFYSRRFRGTEGEHVRL